MQQEEPLSRILVLGAGGAGKTTISRRLSAIYGLPLISLDAEYWNPGWKETAPEPWAARVAELIAGDRWVMDGNFAGTLETRLKRAQLVVLVDLQRRVYLSSALWRSTRHHGEVREEMSPGCPERLNWEFLRYLWQFERMSRPPLLAKLEAYSGRLVWLRSRREATAWVDAVEHRNATTCDGDDH